WRAIRQRRVVGDPYCRRCNYHLANLKEPEAGPPRCPECGVDLLKRRPVRGRAVWRRFIPVGVAVLVLALGYGAMWVGRVPRDGAVSRWFTWPSELVCRWANERKIAWVRPYRAFLNRVV